ncbi:hypothetical protein [Clostridium sp. DL1XJH146]
MPKMRSNERVININKVEKIIITIACLCVLLSGFTIRINKFHWEFKGLINIVFKMIYGKYL